MGRHTTWKSALWSTPPPVPRRSLSDAEVAEEHIEDLVDLENTSDVPELHLGRVATETYSY